MNLPKMLTAEEAAAILRVEPWSVVRLCRSKKLRASKPQKAWLIAQDDLMAYIAEHSNQREDVA